MTICLKSPSFKVHASSRILYIQHVKNVTFVTLFHTPVNAYMSRRSSREDTDLGNTHAVPKGPVANSKSLYFSEQHEPTLRILSNNRNM